MMTATIALPELVADRESTRFFAVSGASELFGPALTASHSPVMRVTRNTLAVSSNDVIRSPNSGVMNPTQLEASGYRSLQPNLAHALETELNAR